MPDARVFIKHFPGDNVPGCGFVVFRGTIEQVYHMPAFMKFGAYQAIRGDQIYTVFFNKFLSAVTKFFFRNPLLTHRRDRTMGLVGLRNSRLG